MPAERIVAMKYFQKSKRFLNYVINIQGDEPFIAPAQIDLLASLLDGTTELATLIKKLETTGTTYQSKYC
ncbi:MAG: hypothetical protein U5K54_01955 [Cytophagales bacterium]|nr:hypothetical protein [Cytophagales bacterium]